MKIFHDKDVKDGVLEGKTIAIIGYGAQGRAQAHNLRDSNCDVIIGVRVDGPSYRLAKDEGFVVFPIDEAVKKADIVHILLPDEVHGEVYKAQIEAYLHAGKTLCCSHGFNIVYKRIVPPVGVDVIMVAPKAPGTEVRRDYVAGFGVPALVAVAADATGAAFDTALGLAKAMHFTRAGCLLCTFEEETHEDLFGEQAVLCGGVSQLIKYAFEVLVEAEYPPEMAYFECMHELKMIVDLLYEGGFEKMNKDVSNTAEWGEYSVGPKIIDESVKDKMKMALRDVENGTFAKQWMAEHQKGEPNLRRYRELMNNSLIEKTGKKIRALFERNNDED